jgi:hypothetical protein
VWRTFFRAFMLDPFGDVPSPGEVGPVPSRKESPPSSAPAPFASLLPTTAEAAIASQEEPSASIVPSAGDSRSGLARKRKLKAPRCARKRGSTAFRFRW